MNAILGLLTLLPGFEREIRLLPLLLRPGQVAVDVGASLGVYSLPMAVIVGASGTVLAFEPRINAATRLRRIGRALRLAALVVESRALGASVGAGRLVIPGRRRAVPGRSFLESSTGSSELDDGLEPRVMVDVRLDTLDEVRCRLGRPIDFVKCDVEGAEYDVFTGARAVLTEDRPVVLCEIEDRHTRRYGRTTADVVGLFAEYGYERLVIAPGADVDHRNVLLVPTEDAVEWRGRLTSISGRYERLGV